MELSRPTRVIAPLAALAALAPIAGLALGLSALTPAVHAQTPSFTLVGYPPPPFMGSRIFALSADGRSAAGYTVGVGIPGFHWTADGGRNDFGRTSPSPSQGLGISGDGHFVVGGANGADNHAFRWSQATGYQSLGTLPGYNNSQAADANHDGSIVVGTLSNGSGSGTQAFRWTQAGGMQGLGGGTAADAISGDGSTIVGTLSSQPRAMYWTQSSGVQSLSPLQGTGDSHARAVNFDGSLIVGNSGPAFVATMWVNGSPMELLNTIPNSRLTPMGVSDTGDVVAGLVSASLAGQFAGVWTAETGIVRLSDYLVSNGVALPEGINLDRCTAISADGLSFAGYTTNGPFGIQGWVATVPSPGVLSILGLACGVALRRRRA